MLQSAVRPHVRDRVAQWLTLTTMRSMAVAAVAAAAARQLLRNTMEPRHSAVLETARSQRLGTRKDEALTRRLT
ncbi:unnamed protein product [Soboliphyme baturini]|uniref:Secreted protein n=1 Tax=Soboliphyme baturini TaxID=241478 RepID=A0A183IFL4_9BILA|nr:unnamed protein product [Soboliphyme baturini]